MIFFFFNLKDWIFLMILSGKKINFKYRFLGRTDEFYAVFDEKCLDSFMCFDLWCFVVLQIIYNRATDQSRGFGFVTMSTEEEAERAVEMFHRYVSSYFFLLSRN